MRILYLGDVAYGQTSLMRMRALQRLGHEVHGVNTLEPWRRAKWLKRQVQRRTHRGSVVTAINDAVIATARHFRPEVIWADKQEFLSASTVDALRGGGATLIHFTPDPYFSVAWKRTPLMDEALRRFDVLVYCKRYERAEYEALGKPLVYMPLGYCDEVHRPLSPNWRCDAGFLGGWEPRRERLLHAVADAGLDLRIWGAHWDFLADGRWTVRRYLIQRQFSSGEPVRIRRDPLLARSLQGGEIYGDAYAEAITGAGIGLGFLRDVCPDQHTTRTFEIPACGSLLLADRTEEHCDLFKEGQEAEFFSSEEECVDKARFYAHESAARTKVASAGRERCVRGRYAYIHRLAQALEEIDRLAPMGARSR